jgi:uncharacterized protein (UPF0261 family)
MPVIAVIGFPKLMVSTVASGETRQYVGVKDVVMFPGMKINDRTFAEVCANTLLENITAASSE